MRWWEGAGRQGSGGPSQGGESGAGLGGCSGVFCYHLAEYVLLGFKKAHPGDLHGGLVVRTLHYHCQEPGFDPS